MKRSDGVLKGFRTGSNPISRKWLQRALLSIAQPKVIFGVMFFAIVTTMALLLTLVSFGGNLNGSSVKALQSHAGWVGPQTAANKYWLMSGNGGSNAGPLCPTEIPFQQWQGCYYTHNGVTYFDDANFKLARKDASINFNWKAGSPAAEVPVDNFSVRWNGVFAFQSGEYTFSLTKDDGMRVFLDGANIFDRFYSETKKDFTFKTNIAEGNHRLKVEYFEGTGGAAAKLAWSLTGPAAGGSGDTGIPVAVTPSATWVGETYKVVSLCSDTDPGISTILSAKANVPFGIKLTEGTYSSLISGGSYVALFELPKSDGSYGGDFTAFAKNIPNDGGATFRLFQLSTSTEIGNQYARVNRHNDCATYTFTVGQPYCRADKSIQVVDIDALAGKAETGKQGYISISGSPVKLYLTDKGAGRYEINTSSFNYPTAPGTYTVEYYFNNYLRSTKTFTVGKCGPTGAITISEMQPTICQGSTRDISVRAIGNRIGTVWDEKHNAVLTITDPDGDGVFKGEGVVTSGVNGKTLILTLPDGVALIPTPVDQQSITPNQNGCAASAVLTVPSSVGMCPNDGTIITASAIGTVPLRIFIRGINYNNARVSGIPGLNVSGAFTPSLGAGGASTLYVATVVDNSGTELASQQIEILKKSNCM